MVKERTGVTGITISHFQRRRRRNGGEERGRRRRKGEDLMSCHQRQSSATLFHEREKFSFPVGSIRPVYPKIVFLRKTKRKTKRTRKNWWFFCAKRQVFLCVRESPEVPLLSFLPTSYPKLCLPPPPETFFCLFVPVMARNLAE